MLKTKIQEKFEKIWSQFVEEVAFFKMFPPYGPMLRKTKKKNPTEIQDLKISKI